MPATAPSVGKRKAAHPARLRQPDSRERQSGASRGEPTVSRVRSKDDEPCRVEHRTLRRASNSSRLAHASSQACLPSSQQAEWRSTATDAIDRLESASHGTQNSLHTSSKKFCEVDSMPLPGVLATVAQSGWKPWKACRSMCSTDSA